MMVFMAHSSKMIKVLIAYLIMASETGQADSTPSEISDRGILDIIREKINGILGISTPDPPIPGMQSLTGL